MNCRTQERYVAISIETCISALIVIDRAKLFVGSGGLIPAVHRDTLGFFLQNVRQFQYRIGSSIRTEKWRCEILLNPSHF
jgi:hypothetical protein